MTISTISAPDEAPSRAVRREETARLLKEASTQTGQRREELIDQVIVLNIGVAHAIAHRYRNRSVPVEDLEQVACMALVPRFITTWWTPVTSPRTGGASGRA